MTVSGGDEPVGRREYETYRDGNDRRVTRLETDLDASDQRHLEDMRAMAKQREQDVERWTMALRLRDEQRTRDLEAAAKQRETDQATAREHAEQGRRWTWGTVIGALAALAALGALAVDTLSKSH